MIKRGRPGARVFRKVDILVFNAIFGCLIYVIPLSAYRMLVGFQRNELRDEMRDIM
jgi:hypothetical protein